LITGQPNVAIGIGWIAVLLVALLRHKPQYTSCKTV
jgi:hypothetical protein